MVYKLHVSHTVLTSIIVTSKPNYYFSVASRAIATEKNNKNETTNKHHVNISKKQQTNQTQSMHAAKYTIYIVYHEINRFMHISIVVIFTVGYANIRVLWLQLNTKKKKKKKKNSRAHSN